MSKLKGVEIKGEAKLPKTRSKAFTRQIVIRIEDRDYEELERTAKANERTITQEVRLRIRKGKTTRPLNTTEKVDIRNPICIERWPECVNGEFNDKCCRFPKSCSC